MNRKKGFTLIELLAVIVILAIIALIATPIILNMINDAKKSAAKDSAYGYIEAIEYNNSMSAIDSKKYPLIESGEVTTLDVKVKGTPPTKGTVTITSGRVTEANLCINNYSVHYDGTTATIEGNACDGTSQPTEYTVYANGTAVYYNPVSGEKCSASEAVSTTGTKTGCMKFYTFNDEGKNASTVNMILDHNTTATVAWNSSGNNADGMNEVKTALESDTTGWKETARLITAKEVAHIVGADKEDTIKWNSSKTYGTDDIETKVAWFYLDGTGTTYSSTDGWQKKVATTQGASKYAWLFDYTNGCTSYGCNIADSSTYGYWTSTPVVGFSYSAWYVVRGGDLFSDFVGYDDVLGVRPVITISKSIIS